MRGVFGVKRSLGPFLLVTLIVSAGCLTDPDSADSVQETSQEHHENEAPAVGLSDGWSHESSDGVFRYDNGTLKGTYDGDQIVLPINNSEPLDLAPMNVTLKAWYDISDEWFVKSTMFAIWNEEEPWPGPFWARASNHEWFSVGGEVAGQSVSHGITNPTAVNILGEDETWVQVKFLLSGPITLEPGQWKVWFAMPTAMRMEVEIELPEGLPLSERPLYSNGCGNVLPSDFESAVLVQSPLLVSLVQDAKWSIDIPEDSTFLGVYFGAGAVQTTEHRFHLPNGTSYEYTRMNNKGVEKTPSDWPQWLLSSTMSGTHTFEVVHDYNAILSKGPQIAYCVI